MSAPSKGTTSDLFLQEMVDLISTASSRNLCLDRSYYGESCIWPKVYGRNSLLSEEDLEILREIEDTVGAHRILMHDPNVEAHWKRCVDNNEPLTKAQFVQARNLYSSMSSKYGFEATTLRSFIANNPEAKEYDTLITPKETNIITTAAAADQSSDDHVVSKSMKKTAEQLKLEQANAINDILSKKILKQKGDLYDSIESDIRNFLNTRLSHLLGTNNQNNDLSFSKEEIVFYKTMFKRAMKEKQ